ncbi:MAG: glycoside hydrolase family 2 [Clostridia bacterium]|nr:glycoside hydrolase family 2 [Clostridia bacterium]
MTDTKFANTPWGEYPRPQFKRDSYFNLNGEWNLSVLKNDVLSPVGTITVPYPPESELSGIKRPLENDEQYVYTKTFSFEPDFIKNHIILHFGAVDQIAEVKINDLSVGEHIGGYLPFSFDITSLILEGENTITVTVTDKLDLELAYGKQRKKRGGMWYTPISGIWQTVWIESVCQKYVENISIKTNNNHVKFTVCGGEDTKTIIIGDDSYTFNGSEFEIDVKDAIMWSPENPHLYYFELISGHDHINSYFALRDIEIKKIGDKAFICLNGKPYFFNGLLDQGYYQDGIYTPRSADEYKKDIMLAKDLGFNMLRKHIKIEPDIFYYYCDKYGMIVFQDMVNSGKYNFFIDTALPTIGLKKGITHRASKYRREHFEQSSKETIALLQNHPCVCYYTIFNEGWGQYDADRIYTVLKTLDPSRVWDATSGWFTEKLSDVKSEHVYFKKLKLKSDGSRPLVLSEFGGYSYKIMEHAFNQNKTYGYRFFDDKEKFLEAIKSLYLDEVIPNIKNGLCATVLTQISDVENETNGLITYDREVVKVDADTMQNLSNLVNQAFMDQFE